MHIIQTKEKKNIAKSRLMEMCSKYPLLHNKNVQLKMMLIERLTEIW